MGTESVLRPAKKVAATIALAISALGGSLVINSTVAEALAKKLTLTTISCTFAATYGTATTCTVTVTDIALFQPKITPTGTVTVGTILNRLNGGSCLLTPVNSSTASCVVSVTPTDTGLMLPLAAYPGDGEHFASVTIIPGAIFASPAPLTITAANANREYGAANPSFAVSYSGFVLGEDETDLLGALNCTTTADGSSVVGDYPITCSGLTSPTSPLPAFSPHYNITWAPGTLHVDQVTLTITANDAVRIHGAANPAFGASFSGFIGTDDEGDLGGTLVCSTSADAASPVGVYDIICSGLTSSEYNIVYANGVLTVLGAPGATLPGGTAALNAGDDLVIDVENWEPGSTVNVDACGGAVIGTITIGPDGKGHGVLTLPGNVNVGDCIVALTGNDQTGNPAQLFLSVVVEDDEDLPPTGVSLTSMQLAALSAIVVGTWLVTASRRRRPAR